MKKSFFLMRYFLDSDKKMHVVKFDDQMNAMKKLGYDVWFIGIDENAVYLCNNENRIKLMNLIKFKNEMLNKIVIHYIIYISVIKSLRFQNHYDFIYIRSMPVIPMFLKALRNLRKTSKFMVLEIPSYPPQNEIALEKSFVRWVMFKFGKIFENHQSKYIDLITVIGEHCENFLSTPALNISNGIDVESVPVRNPVNIDNEIHILALAKMAKWHAYDRLIEGLYNFVNKDKYPKIIIHFVGNDTDGSGAKWEMLTKDKGLESNIVFEGPLSGEKLDSMFNLCDIGVGALGLYRKNMQYTSELKIRDYCARGLPFIYAAIDESILDNPEFCLMEKNDDTPIDFDRLVKFALRVKQNKEIPFIMRNYAKSNMSWESQFELILNKLREI